MNPPRKPHDVECPSCQAKVGKWCMKLSKYAGRVRADYTHSSRVKLSHSLTPKR